MPPRGKARPPILLSLHSCTMAYMDPRNPLFYVSTFVSDNAAGLVPPSRASMDTLAQSMAVACDPKSFQADLCALRSQQVGRIRAQDACWNAPKYPPTGQFPPAPTNSLAVLPGTTPMVKDPTAPQTITAALAALGAKSSTSALAIC